MTETIQTQTVRAAMVINCNGFKAKTILAFIEKECPGAEVKRKAIYNVLERFRKCFNKKNIGGRGSFYTPNKQFFSHFKEEKQSYINLLPKHKDIIEKAFRGESTPVNVSTRPKSKRIRANSSGPSVIYKAVWAAHEKPLSIYDVAEIAKKYGHKLNATSAAYFVYKKPEQIRLVHKIRGRKYYELTERFFEINASIKDKLCEIVPAKKETILKRFNSYVIGQNEQQRQSVIESHELEERNDAHVVQVSQVVETDENEVDTIDAANVGLAIIAYINKLKKQKTATPTEYEALERRHANSQQTIINQQSEIQGLESKIDKLKSIIDGNNEKIKELSHELSVYKNAALDESKPVPSKMKLGDVARITKIIKKPKNNGQGKSFQR